MDDIKRVSMSMFANSEDYVAALRADQEMYWRMDQDRQTLKKVLDKARAEGWQHVAIDVIACFAEPLSWNL